MTVGDALAARAIPCGLLEGGTVTAPVRKGELITYANAGPDPESGLVAMRRKQDELVASL
jgi:predicted homoserine dehydrogenase-like protein